MKRSPLAGLLVSLSSMMLIVACATTSEVEVGEDPNTVDGSSDDATTDRKPPPKDSGSQADAKPTTDARPDTGGGICVNPCDTDTDCQDSCPPATGGSVNCCDPDSKICFVSSSGSCSTVTPDEDAGL